jgi:hypothetical protein
MPFVTIKGRFTFCGQSANGNPTGFQPDGDWMQFKPDDALLLHRLEKTADAYRLTSIGSTQLRFEGIGRSVARRAALAVVGECSSSGTPRGPRTLMIACSAAATSSSASPAGRLATRAKLLAGRGLLVGALTR